MIRIGSLIAALITANRGGMSSCVMNDKNDVLFSRDFQSYNNRITNPSVISRRKSKRRCRYPPKEHYTATR
jgi:hypothetical protein